MQLNPPTNRLLGDMPKIGIRPTIDGRLGGVRESLEELTMDMARNVARFLGENLRHSNGLPVECVIADTCIGGVAEAARTRRAVPQGRRRRIAHRHAVLVLRLRDDGHGPAPAQGGLGLQRHGAARRRLPGRRLRRAQPEGPARLQHLRPRRAGRGRQRHSRRRAGEAAALRQGRAWPWPPCAGSRTWPWAASPWASPAPS